MSIENGFEEKWNLDDYEISSVLAKCLTTDKITSETDSDIDKEISNCKSLNDFTLTQILNICMKDSTTTKFDDLTYSLRDLDYDYFRSILKGTSLEVFSEELINFQNEYFRKQEIKDKIIDILNQKYVETYREQLKFTELLIFLIEKGKGKYGIDISFADASKNKKIIRDNEYLQYIIKATKEYYVSKKYNYTQLTYDEALAKLQNPIFRKDLEDSYAITNQDVSNIDINNIPHQVVEYFAHSIITPRDITEDLLREIKRDNEEIVKNFEVKKNPGRQALNLPVGRLSLNLSYLIRLDRFIKQDEVNDIYQLKIKNEDLELIYK